MSKEITGELPQMETQKPKEKQVEERPKTREELEEIASINELKTSFRKKREAIDSSMATVQELGIQKGWHDVPVRVRRRTEEDGSKLGNPLIVEILGLDERLQQAKETMEAQRSIMQSDVATTERKKPSLLDRARLFIGSKTQESTKYVAPATDIAAWTNVHDAWKDAQLKAGLKERMQKKIEMVVNALDLSHLTNNESLSVASILKEAQSAEDRVRKQLDQKEAKLIAEVSSDNPDLTKTQLYFEVKK